MRYNTGNWVTHKGLLWESRLNNNLSEPGTDNNWFVVPTDYYKGPFNPALSGGYFTDHIVEDGGLFYKSLTDNNVNPLSDTNSWTIVGGKPLTYNDIITALNYSPYNSANPAGYITNADLSGYVPYAGSTNDLDMGLHVITGHEVTLDPLNHYRVGKNPEFGNFVLISDGIATDALSSDIVFNSTAADEAHLIYFPTQYGDNRLHFGAENNLIAYLSDVPDVSGFIPYTGAVSNIVMGRHDIAIDGPTSGVYVGTLDGLPTGQYTSNRFDGFRAYGSIDNTSFSLLHSGRIEANINNVLIYRMFFNSDSSIVTGLPVSYQAGLRSTITPVDSTDVVRLADLSGYALLASANSFTAQQQFAAGAVFNGGFTYDFGSSGNNANIFKNGSNVLNEFESDARYPLDANVVHKTGNENIAGFKNFTDGITTAEITAFYASSPTITTNLIGGQLSLNTPTAVAVYGANKILFARPGSGFESHLLFSNPSSAIDILLPSVSGTLALTSDLAAYLPLTGGTLSGMLTASNFHTTSATPFITVGAAAGGGGTVSIVGTNQDGMITIVTGSSIVTGGTFATISMSGGFFYPTTCVPVITPHNSGASIAMGNTIGVIVGGVNRTGFNLDTTLGNLAPLTTYIWFYHNGGY